MIRPKIIRSIYSVNKTCLLIFHNEHAFERKFHTNLCISVVYILRHQLYLIAIPVYFTSVYAYRLSTVGGQNIRNESCRMPAFCRNAIHFELVYSGFLPSNVQTFHIQKPAVYLTNARVTFLTRYGHSVPCLFTT